VRTIFIRVLVVVHTEYLFAFIKNMICRAVELLFFMYLFIYFF